MTRKSTSDIHPIYTNLDRVAYERGNILKGTTIGATFSALAAFEEQHGLVLIRSSSVSKRDGHISIQTDFMMHQAATTETCMQSDSIHGFVTDDHFHDVNVTFTSVFCPTIQRTVPLLISILFGKTQAHYQVHFQVLFKSLPYKTWQEFTEQFPGMTCDFSDAERAGFELALRNNYNVTEFEEIQLENHYRFCDVHFKRSLTRVRRNGAIMLPAKEMEFYHAALQLIELQHTSKTFDALVSQMRKEYPKANRWIDWYLHPSRGKHIFPAVATGDFSHMSKDTNAQESLGGDFQRTASKHKLLITETFQHSYLYMQLIEKDHGYASRGAPIRYKRHKKKSRVFHNDGRAPDTTKTLLSQTGNRDPKHGQASNTPRTPLTQVGPGRPKGSRNKVPKLGSDIDWSTFGIPWSFSYNGFVACNTCPLDTPLMSWYLLYRFSEALLPVEVQETDTGMVLSSILMEISSEQYDRARWLWCTKILHLSETGTHDLWGSIEQVFLEQIPSLVRLSASLTSKCSSPLCPQSFRIQEVVLQSLIARNPWHITQQDLNNSFTPDESPCSEHIDDDVVLEHDSDTFRYQAVTDVDTGEGTGWHACKGNRTWEEMQFSTLPYLLVLDCLECWHSTQGPVQGPAQVLYIDRSEYHLAAIMYGSGAHFCCTTMVKGRPIFYDGMKSRRLQWLAINKMEPPSGFQMNQVWYLKKEAQNVPSGQQQPVAFHPVLEPIATLSRSTFEQENDEDGPFRASNRTGDVMSTVVEEKPRQKTRYPMGLSTGIVGLNGRLPTCTGCGQAIDRGSQRLLLRTTINAAKFWTTTTSFHFKEGCITGMRDELQKKAMALISPLVLAPSQLSAYPPTKTKKQWTKRRAVLRELSTSLGPAWTSTALPRMSRNNGH